MLLLRKPPRDARMACVATIGNFDGVHLGHQAVLRQLDHAAAATGFSRAVVLFEPQPREFFMPGAVPRLTTLREKLDRLRTQPLDVVLCLRFDAQLAALEASAFIEQILVAGLGVRHLVIGDDFRFGRGRVGDFALLKASGARLGFTVEATETLLNNGHRVSSTRIRDALLAGDLAEAEACLGRSYAVVGRVVAGDRRGRTLGVPTANIALGHRMLPLSGVFAVAVRGIARSQPLWGVANAGVRPTVEGTTPSLEVHILDFDGDLYGRRLTVEFLRRQREERRFASLQELKTQIGCDIEEARRFFAGRETRASGTDSERKRL
ncbi:MAG: bifunctional riboflavin kinase/FAD synthetase [Acidiferrobacteraceae bacterium]